MRLVPADLVLTPHRPPQFAVSFIPARRLGSNRRQAPQRQRVAKLMLRMALVRGDEVLGKKLNAFLLCEMSLLARSRRHTHASGRQLSGKTGHASLRWARRFMTDRLPGDFGATQQAHSAGKAQYSVSVDYDRRSKVFSLLCPSRGDAMKARSLFDVGALDMPQNPDGLRILDQDGNEVFFWTQGANDFLAVSNEPKRAPACHDAFAARLSA